MHRSGAFPKLIGFVESNASTRLIIGSMLFAAVVVGLEASKARKTEEEESA